MAEEDLMQIEPGVLARAIAVPHAAIAPPLLTRVAPVDGSSTTTTDVPRKPKQPDLAVIVTLPDAEGVSLPDAETIATMQLMTRIPREDA